MSLFNDAEELFLSDIKQKKKDTASKIISQKHKRLGKGNMRFASDFMTRKEKIQHMGAGKVMTSNLYDTILPIDEFKKLEEFEQRNRLAYLRTKFDNRMIMKEMGLTNANYYSLVNKLGLPKAPRTTHAERSKRKATAKTTIAKTAIAVESAPAPMEASTATAIKEQAPIQEIIIDGLHLVYNGTYSSDQIIKQFLKFGALLEDDQDNYYIELKLVQKVKQEGN
jgi:hypothetical protein